MQALYPGLDKTYNGSGEKQLHWNVLEDPPGNLGRAGDHNHHFVDQDVATFASIDPAFAFVQESANKWKTCAGRIVTAKYSGPHADKYTWTIGPLAGEAPKISLLYTQEGSRGYACQRVLNEVSNFVIDVKACGDHITNETDEAGKIADTLAAKVPGSTQPKF